MSLWLYIRLLQLQYCNVCMSVLCLTLICVQYTHMHTHSHARTHSHMHTHMHTHMHMHTRVHTHTAAQAKLELERVRDLYTTVQKQHASHKSKNIEFFLCVEQLCQRLRGGRLTCCKSGKDRTGMAVTLEECSVLRTNHHLMSKTYTTTLATLRS